MKRTTLLLILTLTLLNGKLIANDPQGSLSANGPLCGSGTGTLTWTATAHNGPLTIVYKENGGTDRTAYDVYSGTPFNAYTNPVTSTTVYTIVSVTNDGNGDVRTSGFTEGSATITVDPLPSASLTVSGSSTLCSGSGTNISVALSETGVNYQLRNSAGNVNVGPAVAGDGATIDLPTGSLSSTTTFNILATNTTTNCSVQLSGGAAVTINPLPQGSLTANGPFCGSGAGKLTWTATMGTGPYTIVYNDGLSDRTKTGVVSSSPFDVFTTPVTTSTTYTLVSVTDETTTCARSGSFTSGSVTISINPFPSNSLTIGGGATLCSGLGTNITVALSESGVNYQLRNNFDNSSINGPVAGTTGTINLPTGNLSATTTFNILATNPVSTCAVQLTGTVVVSVNPLPQGSLSANGPFCNTGTGKLTWTATAGTGPYTIVYNDGSGNQTKSGVISGTPFDVFTNPVTSNTTYTLVSVTDGSSCTRTTGFTGSSSSITVNPLPVVTFITEPGPGPVCVDDQVTYTTQSGMSAYNWNLPGTLNVDYIITSGGTGTDNTVKLEYLSGGSKTVRVNYNTSAGCTAASPAVSVATTVNTLPNLNLVVGGGTSICAGTGTNITVALSESEVNYQLRNNAGNININTPVAGTSGSINLPTGILSTTTTFNILASNATTGCSEQLIGTATVTVYPLPSVTTSSAASTCNGQSPNISLTASTPSSFTWTVGTITGGITGASGSSGSTINQVLTNPGNSTAGTVEYLVTPTSTTGSCTGSPKSIVVTVNPTPAITNVATASTCSGTGPNISLTSSAPSNFAWTIGTVAGGITGYGAASGSTINQVLTNPSNTLAGSVGYIVTPTSVAGSCVGSPHTITVTVNPAPSVTNGATAAICNATGPAIGLTSSISSTYAWTIGAITGSITGAGANSGPTINQTLTNPSNSVTGTVEYLVVPTSVAASCSGSSRAITVSVYPAPLVTTATSTAICSNTGPNISLTSSTPSTFTWTIGAVSGSIAGAGAGSGGTINQILTNSSATAQSVEYMVTPTSTTGSCTGPVSSITVAVNPSPTLTLVSQTAKVCDGSQATISLVGLLPGTTSTVSYTINGIARTPITNVGPSDGSGAASFTSAALVAANNGKYLRVTGITTTSSSPNCSMTFTFDAPMSVDPTTVAGAASLPQDICYGTTPADLNLSGNTGNVIKWQKALDIGFSSPSNISATTTTLPGASIGNLYVNTYFRAVVQSGVCFQENATPVLVTIKPLPTPSISGPAPVNVNTTGNIYNTEAGKSSYTWTISGAGNSITGVTGTDAIAVTWNTPGDQTVTVNYLENGCSAVAPVSKSVHVNARPVAGNVTILGDPRSGLTLNTFYNYTDADSDNEGISTFQWYTGSDAGGSGSVAIPSALSRSYRLKDADTTKYIGFSVVPLAQTGASPGAQATTTVWVGPVINSAPTASSVAITGSKNVGGVLTGHYTYSDLENDLEFQSLFQWYSSTSLTGTYTPVPGEIYNTHLIDNNEQGRYFQFHVMPKAATGRTAGLEVVSAAYGPANSQPFADNVTVTGTPTIGSILTGNYNYHDVDGDIQGPTSFRWLKTGSSGTIPISGASGTTYTLTSADEGYTIVFEVTPVALTGFPLAGTPVSSTRTGPVLDPSVSVPVADQVCISGIRKVNEVITGKYNYTFYKSEGVSVYRWLKAGIPISGATGTQYTLTQSDIDSGQEIAFEVTPRSSNYIPKEGVTVTSNPLARIKLKKVNYSLADTAFVLVPNVSGGVFSGKGVSNGYFSPWNADTANKPPHTISYLLNIVNTLTTCSQQATVQISVVAVNSYMVGLQSLYCYDGRPDTIFVENVPPLGTNRKFQCTNPYAIIKVLHNDTVIIDPGRKRPGISKDTLIYSYTFNGSYFPITRTYETDSVGVAFINGLNSGDVFCTNDVPKMIFPSLTGSGGVISFTGPITNNGSGNYLLDPSLGLGNTLITYRYTRSGTGCFSSIEVPVKINPAPIVAFKPLSVCVANSADSTRFINKTISIDSISVSGWYWKIDDGGLMWPSTSKHPSHLFKFGGDHKVSLTAKTIQNCTATKDTTIGIGFKPAANFYWNNDCYHTPKDSIILHDTTFSTATILSRTWKFGIPPVVIKTAGLDTLLSTSFIKADTGILLVTYKVSTSYKNCDDSITKSIYVRPTIPLLTADYFQNFDNGRGGWVKEDENDKTWSFGRPNRNIINHGALGGMYAWFTDFDTLNQKAVSSSIISPCFDFTAIQRPMISMELFKRFDNNRDGAALQYKIRDSRNWVLIGSEDDGINWYNSTVIRGKPGGDQQIGWTSGVAKDVTWAESRHTLDELSGKKDVKFRIAYGSDGNAVGNEGIAFDDIRIGPRSRKVLLEHFTNLTNSASSNSNTIITGLAKRMKTDVINIQYHTNFPGTDPFYNDNPADASARFLFYGLSKAPYSMVDGGNHLNFANIYDYVNTPFDSLDLIRRSMVSPTFAIDLTSIVSGNIVTVSGQIRALGPLTSENVTLYLVVTEKQNRKNKGVLPGDTVYFNVFRKFIPDAAGIGLKKSWVKDETYTLSEKSWVIEKISNAGEIEVIAFIQNNSSKEVYQSQSIVKNIVVGTDNRDLNGTDGFSVYPNPASNRLTIEFGSTLKSVTDIVIYDYKGTVVKTCRTGFGQEEYTIDNLSLPNGIYLVRVTSGGVDWGYKKLIIALK
jgi:hypothetical protein